jgi:hypothetical protein
MPLTRKVFSALNLLWRNKDRTVLFSGSAVSVNGALSILNERSDAVLAQFASEVPGGLWSP